MRIQILAKEIDTLHNQKANTQLIIQSISTREESLKLVRCLINSIKANSTSPDLKNQVNIFNNE